MAGYFKGFEVKRLLLLVIGVLPLTAHCEVVSENLCFEMGDGSPVKFELRTLRFLNTNTAVSLEKGCQWE